MNSIQTSMLQSSFTSKTTSFLYTIAQVLSIMASQYPFAGKVIAITGAASGIGLVTAHYLAQRGASLSLADIQQKELLEAEASIKSLLSPNARVLANIVDIQNNLQVEQWIERTVAEFGKLDGAAN